MIGLTIGRYEVISELGAGGMGVVYRARDPILERDVALKVLAPHLASDPRAREDFLSEARAAAKLNHPNIVTVFEAGEDNGQVFIAMELVEGGDLKTELEIRGRFDVEHAVRLIGQIAAALDYSHSQPQPVIHRDIKPANILVTKDGRAKVADFGIAKVQGDIGRTGTGMLKGTLSYMAPELFEGTKPNPQTDQWSLAVLAYEILAGANPFVDPKDSPDDQLSVIMRIAKANPPKLILSTYDSKSESAIEKAIRRSLEREARQRYDSSSALHSALAHIVSPGSVQRSPKWLFALIAILLISIIAISALPRDPYEPPVEYSDTLKRAKTLLDALSSDSAITKLGTSAFSDVYARSLADIERYGDDLSKMDVPPAFKADGLYLKGAASLYHAYHCMVKGDQKGLDEAIGKTARAWKLSFELELSDENRRNAKKGVEQAIVLHKSWNTALKPDGEQWKWLTDTLSVNENNIR